MSPQEVARKKRALNRLRGIPNRVPHAQAAGRINALRSTMSWADLSAATGCSAAHLRRIAAGREPRINRVTHNKIMAIQPSSGGHVFVDALGSRRRIQALQARSHSQYVIAAAAGTSQYRINLICNGQPAVRLHMAQRIAEAYRVLADQEGTSTRGRNLAAANGWPGPEYWDEDDLDDPDFVPATGNTLRYIRLAEDGLELEHQQGYTRQQAADRLGVSKDALQQAISRYRDQQQTAA